MHQVAHTAISAQAFNGRSAVEPERFGEHQVLPSLEVSMAHNRATAKRTAGAWERRERSRR